MRTISPQVSALLHHVVTNDRRNARFLNTLAYMEYLGAQKLSHMGRVLPSSTFFLEHIAEEYRHAFFLRQLANKLAPMDNFTDDTLCEKKASRSYIYSVDRHICRVLHRYNALNNHRRHLPYLLSTRVIETRALPFYRLYQSILDERAVAINIKSVISEEEHHLIEMNQAIEKEQLPSALVEECHDEEEKHFTHWIEALVLFHQRVH